MGHHEPVTDWKTDFDHTDDAWAADPYPIWDDLRGECPVAHTGRYGGAWLPTRFEDVAAIAYDTERFTSRSVVVSEFRPPARLAPAGIAPPISSDPPYHKDARRMLLPLFSPQAVDKLESSTPRLLRGAHRRPRAARRRGWGNRVRPAHPRAGHRQHARSARVRRRRVPPLREPRPRGRRPASRASAPRG